jgi:hypothetical protein
MIDYDAWKLDTPEDEPENTCGWCGEPCDDNFCDKNCAKYYRADMEN